MDEAESRNEAVSSFEREVGITGIANEITQAGNESFLKFQVGRNSPLYEFALLACQQHLSPENIFRGRIGLKISKAPNFASSREATVLRTLLSRSTRTIVQQTSTREYSVPYVPFPKGEDYLFSQPATHIVRGRRGVGKSTLMKRSLELLAQKRAISVAIDMQAYSALEGEDLSREVLHDVCLKLSKACPSSPESGMLTQLASEIIREELSLSKATLSVNRVLAEVTNKIGQNAFVFLDDFHLVDFELQPLLLQIVQSSLKGANGWLKVAGLSSLLNHYDVSNRMGLQVPGDAQFVSLDLTLENPDAAESHLKAILDSFLKAVGYELNGAVIPDAAFRRLVWANAGVPRDFLQMFGRSLEHAQRNQRACVALSDVNIAIGEFGQTKMDDLQCDAKNSEGMLRALLNKLEKHCLDDNKVNAFLLRSEESKERKLVETLSDLRLVHIIHQSITPDRVGEKYQAFILDYSLFTGFRRRREVKELLPTDRQFKAEELRQLPKVKEGFSV